jgi:hypothetical protein
MLFYLFIKIYVMKRDFLDGSQGLVISILGVTTYF